MFDLAKSQPGFLGFKSVRQELGITISYWKSIENILMWEKHTKHQVAQNKGINEWYASYDVEICLVERVYSM
jgi:heme-degrading monooxygenase HmoA